MKFNHSILAAGGALALSAGAALADCGTGETGLIAFEIDRHTVLGYVPEGAADTPMPMVLNLHPSGGTGLRSLNEARPIAEKEGFIMIAPTGAVGPIFSGMTWNVPGVPTFGAGNYPPEDTRDEVAFLDAVIEKAKEVACVDENRIYAMGYSGGARMTSRLACDLGDKLAAVAPIAGIRFSLDSDKEFDLPNAIACTPPRPVPVMALHGYWDPTNPWHDTALGETPFDKADGSGKVMSPAPKHGTSWAYSGQEALERWVEHNGCDPEPKITDVTEDVERHDYQNCDGDVSLMFFEEIGHAIPGYDQPWAPGQATSTLNGYQVAWDLMKGYALSE